MSLGELERVTRRYTAAIMDIIGPDRDVPAPDMGTNSQIMAWIMDTYSMHQRQTCTAVVTGKPVPLGGSLGRLDATGRGIQLCTREALLKQGIDANDCSVAIQGAGNVGQVSAKFLSRMGCKIYAISDIHGAVVNEDGLDIDKLQAHLEKHRTLEHYQDGDRVTNAELLVLPVDILVPAATENVVTSKNAHEVQAKFIVEGANGPVTPAADQILEEKGVTVIPDILANAGGVTVSYFEWVQDRIAYFWDQDEVDSKMENIMVGAFNDVVKMAEGFEVSYRIAAYMLAIDRVSQMARLRGIYA